MERQPRLLAAAFDNEAPILCLALSQARSPDVVLIAAASGFDAVYIDLEHGVTPLDVTSMLCTTALGSGIVPLVRVPSLEASFITRVLDGGALGVIAPHVTTSDEAQALVDTCRFPPVGRRTLYALTPVTGYRALPADELTAVLDREVVVIVMIESRLAVENADKIAATEGVDVLLVGPHDLSADLGVAGDVSHPKVREALLEVARTCAQHQKRFGVAGINDPILLNELAQHGLGYISAGTDTGLLRQAATARVDELRQLLHYQEDESP